MQAWAEANSRTEGLTERRDDHHIIPRIACITDVVSLNSKAANNLSGRHDSSWYR